jgi:hypothetical protein
MSTKINNYLENICIDKINDKSFIIQSYFVLFPSSKMVNSKHNININEPFENNKNIIYDKLSECYYYNLSFNKNKYKVLDVITNIKCNYELSKIFFLYNLEIKCDINKVTLPLVSMYYTPINFLIKIDKQDNINIDLSFDAYTIRTSYLMNFACQSKIVNDKNLVFCNGLFIGYYN